MKFSFGLFTITFMVIQNTSCIVLNIHACTIDFCKVSKLKMNLCSELFFFLVQWDGNFVAWWFFKRKDVLLGYSVVKAGYQ